MGGRDATDHVGLVCETPSEELYDKAARTLSRLAVDHGASAPVLREMLLAIGYPPDRLKPSLVSARFPTVPSPRIAELGPPTDVSGTVTAPPVEMCRARIGPKHPLAGDNLGIRGDDGRRFCKACVKLGRQRKRDAKKAAKTGKTPLALVSDLVEEPPPVVAAALRDPELCGRQLHRWSDPGVAVVHSRKRHCEPCRQWARRWTRQQAKLGRAA